MQSLPTLLNTRELDELIAQFPASCEVFRGDKIVTIRATNKQGERKKLLSAVSPTGHKWHVMTAPGIISTELTAE